MADQGYTGVTTLCWSCMNKYVCYFREMGTANKRRQTTYKTTVKAEFG